MPLMRRYSIRHPSSPISVSPIAHRCPPNPAEEQTHAQIIPLVTCTRGSNNASGSDGTRFHLGCPRLAITNTIAFILISPTRPPPAPPTPVGVCPQDALALHKRGLCARGAFAHSLRDTHDGHSHSDMAAGFSELPDPRIWSWTQLLSGLCGRRFALFIQDKNTLKLFAPSRILVFLELRGVCRAGAYLLAYVHLGHRERRPLLVLAARCMAGIEIERRTLGRLRMNKLKGPQQTRYRVPARV
ncbi:hypothetical protein C8Q76DRAFT_725578 [Earliella scabrosa]|nr:hypothetical protein C8Q76DRAFT_725578 [Earliella scabrosa]